jgi:hypothetical protein
MEELVEYITSISPKSADDNPFKKTKYIRIHAIDPFVDDNDMMNLTGILASDSNQGSLTLAKKFGDNPNGSSFLVFKHYLLCIDSVSLSDLLERFDISKETLVNSLYNYLKSRHDKFEGIFFSKCGGIFVVNPRKGMRSESFTHI